MDSLSCAVGKVSLVTINFAGIDDLVPKDIGLHILSFFGRSNLVKKEGCLPLVENAIHTDDYSESIDSKSI
eukprot:scaffold136744_cov24-Attheya_sp.AAC.1